MSFDSTPHSQPSEPVVVHSKKQVLKTGLVFCAVFIGAMIVVGALVFGYFSATLPKIFSINDYHPLGVTKVMSGKEILAEFYKEYRYVIQEDQFPQKVIQAFISAEDDGFFEHQGVSPMAIIRASIANFKAGQVVQGGSTITQQVAKSLFLSSERSFIRKIKEVIMASRLEKNLTKQQILFLYLNQIYLGQGAYGVEAAARVYFHKDIREISVPEAALLAAMPRAPGRFSPYISPKRAKERQLYVLKRMFENKYITETEMMDAGAKPIRVYRTGEAHQNIAPYYVEHLRRYLIQKYGEEMVYEKGLTVSLPVDPKLLKVSATALQDGVRAVDKRRGYRGAVRKLATDTERTEFFQQSQNLLVEKNTPYTLFMPDGRLGTAETLQELGLLKPASWFDADSIYEALVMRVDDATKKARVRVGDFEMDLPFDNLKWAQPFIDGSRLGPEPKFVSNVLSVNDLIHIRVVSKKTEPLVAQLEQIPTLQSALFSIDTRTGYVLAMVGGYDYQKSEFNRAVQAQRQPGSAFKPFIYSASIENGFTPASIIVDSPVVFKDGDVGTWRPENFSEKFYGDTTLHQAFIKSRNIPTIKLVQSLGVNYMIDYAKRFGMTGKLPNDLSISLGSGLVSLQELTQMYAVFPRLGRKITPIFYTQIKDSTGAVLEENPPHSLPQGWEITQDPTAAPVSNPIVTPPEVDLATTPATEAAQPGAKFAPGSSGAPIDPEMVLDQRVAAVMNYLMKDVIKYGTGARALALGRPAAGKTGTTNEYKDAWFMGYTPQVATGVWVGFDDSNESLGPGETGAEAALPIWSAFMKEAMAALPFKDFAVPPGVVFAPINPDTGKLMAEKSTQARFEAFIQGTEPKEYAPAKGEAVDTQSDFLKESYE